MIEVVEMTLGHAYLLAKDLRDGDVLECEAIGDSPRKILRDSFYKSIIKKTVLLNGEVVACFGGTGSILGNVFHPWLLTSKLVEKAYLPLALLYRRQVKEFMAMYPRLENWCDSRYTKSLNLLRLVGFHVDAPKPHGSKGHLFCRFWHEAEAMNVRKCTIAELEEASNIYELLDEYAAEASIEGLPPPSAKAETYKHLEKTGALVAFGAFFDKKPIGFITVLAPELPHYCIRMAVSESFFVAKEHRKSGAGLRLLAEAEKYAKSIGSPGLLLSAPTGGDLARVLPGVGYKETNQVFFRNLQ